MSENIERQETGSPQLDTSGWKGYFISFLNLFDKPLEKIGANVILIIIFSIIYSLIMLNDEREDHFNTIEDVIYFTVTTHFTVGFGDLSPQTTMGRIAMILHVFLVWVVNMVPLGLEEIMKLSEQVQEEEKRKKNIEKRKRAMIERKTSKLAESIRFKNRRSNQIQPEGLTSASSASPSERKSIDKMPDFMSQRRRKSILANHMVSDLLEKKHKLQNGNSSEELSLEDVDSE